MSMLLGHQTLHLDRCPFCGISKPNLTMRCHAAPAFPNVAPPRQWAFYGCAHCLNMVGASASAFEQPVTGLHPGPKEVSETIPDPARTYLRQAIDSLHSPAGSIMLCASSIDAMLKSKNYIEGVLDSRIKAAARDHLITPEMARWAQDVKLDANDQRHADVNAALPTQDDAKRGVEFTLALGEFLFVLPSRVQRGIASAPSTK